MWPNFFRSLLSPQPPTEKRPDSEESEYYDVPEDDHDDPTSSKDNTSSNQNDQPNPPPSPPSSTKARTSLSANSSATFQQLAGRRPNLSETSQIDETFYLNRIRNERDHLSQFIKQRLLATNAENPQDSENDLTPPDENQFLRVPSDSDSSSPEREDDNNEEESSLDVATAPDLSTQEDEALPCTFPKDDNKKKKKNIPHVDETTLHATSIHTINLHCSSVDLPILKTNIYWELRDVNRMSKWHTLTTDENGRPFQEDDGPLASIYSQVLSIEMVEEDADDDDDDLNRVRNAASAAFLKRTKSTQRIVVFFYNGYATQMSQLLKTRNCLISLRQIPSKCVFPFRCDDDSVLIPFSKYCICIGDESRMKINRNGTMEKIRFDDEVEIRVLGQGEDLVEYVVTAESVAEGSSMVALEPSELLRCKRRRLEEGNDDGGNFPSSTRENLEATQFFRSKPWNSWKEGSPPYEYHVLHQQASLLPLLKQKDNNKRIQINIFGIVLSFGSPVPTKRNDWMISLVLLDDSLPEEETSNYITMNVFATTPKKLPGFCKMGDVICGHRITVNEWNNEIQLVGIKENSSFITIRPKHEIDPHPPPTDQTFPPRLDPSQWDVFPSSEKSYTFSPQDEARSIQLWHWGQRRLAQYPTMNPNHRFTISNMGNDSHDVERTHQPVNGDLTAMITDIIPMPEELRTNFFPRGFLRVWDGTGPSIVDNFPIENVSAPPEDPPPAAVKSVEQIIHKLNANSDTIPPLDVPKSLLGRVINVAIYEKPQWYFIMGMKLHDGQMFTPRKLKVGDFVRLRNVTDGHIDGKLRCLIVHSKSCITPLPETTFEIRIKLQEHQKRISNNDPPNVNSALLPPDSNRSLPMETENHQHRKKSPRSNLPNSSSDEDRSCIAECLGEPAPYTSRIQFSIENTHPPIDPFNPNDLKKLCSPNQSQSDKQTVPMAFYFLFRVFDDTADLDIAVPNDVAESLLGVKADEVFNSEVCCRKGMENLKKVLDSRLEGTIRSELVPNMDEKYFILKTLCWGGECLGGGVDKGGDDGAFLV